jgi:polyisoprenoid-binding protein YceI
VKSSTRTLIAVALSSACAIGAGIALAQNPPAEGMGAGGEAGMGGGGMGAGEAAGMGGGGPRVIVPLTKNLAEVKPGDYVLEHDHGRIVVSVSHHGFSMLSFIIPTVDATLKFDAADVTRSQLNATAHMTSVSSLIQEFDGKLNSAVWLNTGKYPTSNFKSTKIVRTGPNELRVTGDLTFLGVTKPATMDVNFVQAGNVMPPNGGYRVGFNGKMVINRSEWGMEKSTVGDEVTLTLEGEFLEPAAAAAAAH